MAFWQDCLNGMWSYLPETSTAAWLGHHTVLGFTTFKIGGVVFQALSTRIHISWLTSFSGVGSWPSTPGTPHLVPPTEAVWGINLGLTMSWSGAKPVIPSRRNPFTWNIFQAGLDTPKIMCRFYSTFPTNGGDGRNLSPA